MPSLAIQPATASCSPLDAFRDRLAQGDPLETIRAGLIGENVAVPGPNGPQPLVYADYVASGRALDQVEDFVRHEVLPWYANSHSETSYCGAYVTRLREAARATIAALLGAGAEHAVIFTGSGATAGLNRLPHLFGLRARLAAGGRVAVLTGPFEHHSNILPWRESGATVIEIGEDASGRADQRAIAATLADLAGHDLVVGSFSAASNVTGIIEDVAGVTRLLKRHGALAVWDYAAGGPYLPVSLDPAPDAAIDAVVLSPHKFVGGPGSSGLLVVRRASVSAEVPTFPGGGSVRFVSPWRHDYVAAVEEREEAGTPNVIGDVRAALALLVKDAVGEATIAGRNAALARLGLERLGAVPSLRILGNRETPRLPIFSFHVAGADGGRGDYVAFTRALSDRYGIQARGGCSCAGPYGHRLLAITQEESEAMRTAILAGERGIRPGWVRLNLSHLMTDDKAAYVLDSVAALATQFARAA